ncbi:unnamed protein product, partial [Phaeothamnion confervicola]
MAAEAQHDAAPKLLEVNIDPRGTLLLESSWSVGIGGSLWTSGLQIAEHMGMHGSFYDKLFKDARILELGCGTGLVGLAAAFFGPAKEIVLTDLASHLGLVRANVERNRHRLSSAERSGGAGIEGIAAAAAATAVCAVEYSWGHDAAHLVPPFDVVLATDASVAYFPHLHDPLIAALRDTTDCDSVVILGVTRIDTGPDFFRKLEKAGFEYYALGEEAFGSDYRGSGFGLFTVFRQ